MVTGILSQRWRHVRLASVTLQEEGEVNDSRFGDKAYTLWAIRLVSGEYRHATSLLHKKPHISGHFLVVLYHKIDMLASIFAVVLFNVSSTGYRHAN